MVRKVLWTDCHKRSPHRSAIDWATKIRPPISQIDAVKLPLAIQRQSPGGTGGKRRGCSPDNFQIGRLFIYLGRLDDRQRDSAALNSAIASRLVKPDGRGVSSLKQIAGRGAFKLTTNCRLSLGRGASVPPLGREGQPGRAGGWRQPIVSSRCSRCSSKYSFGIPAVRGPKPPIPLEDPSGQEARNLQRIQGASRFTRLLPIGVPHPEQRS